MYGWGLFLYLVNWFFKIDLVIFIGSYLIGDL